MNSRSFYNDIKPFDNFQEILKPENYYQAPDDWYAVIADIKGSTKAIEAGKYKEVNTVGASCIIAVLNAIDKDIQIPYVFGGDGASFLIPPDQLDATLQALSGTQEMAKDQFDLNVRVGLLKTSDMHDTGSFIRVAKYNLSNNITTAMFSGGGFNKADALIKQHEDKYSIKNHHQDLMNFADFSGLECRWNPIKSKRGKIVTLIAMARNDDSNKVYGALLTKIDAIYGKKNNYRPNCAKDMSLAFNARSLRPEHKIRTHKKDFRKKISYALKIIYQYLLGILFFKLNFKNEKFDGEQYVNELIANTDFQKFDDSLRMVIDSTHGQTNELEAYLEEEYRKGNIYYGMHLAEEALLTCLVFSRISNHLHFIDGASGGYALAARKMKEQIKKVREIESGAFQAASS